MVKLEVTAVGEAVADHDRLLFRVPGSKDYFELLSDPESQQAGETTTDYELMRQAMQRGNRVTMVTGRVDGWSGRWPTVLRKRESKPRKILVTHFETAN